MSVESGVRKYFAWAGGQIVAEYEASGANALIWKTSYVYLGGRLLATTSGIDGTETRFHHPDRLGTRLVTAADGTVVTEQWTLPFGNMQPFTSVPGGENPYQHPTLSNPSKKRFTSYDRSEVTELDYAVNRFYSPQQGRFTQVDPIGMGAASLGNPQTLNMYAYCGNDPINHVDPDGLFAIPRIIIDGVRSVGGILIPRMVLIVIGEVFSRVRGGSSRQSARTPPTFPGKTPSISLGDVLRKIKVPTGIGGNVDPRTPKTFPGGVSAFLQDPNVKVMTRGEEEDISWFWLGIEWLLGVGPEERHFGPDSRMTKSIRSSPDVDYHRKAFCAGGQKPYKEISRFGLLGWGIDTTPPGMAPTRAEDGAARANVNMGRQFVGSFEMRISRIAGSDEVSFVAYNETSITSLTAGLGPSVSRGNGKSILELPGSTTKQYYYWRENNPCAQK